MGKQPVDRGVTRTKLQLCPHCGYHFDAAGTVDGSAGAPSPGDAAVCIHCAEALVFAGSNVVRKPTPKETLAFSTDPDWAELRQKQSMLRYMQRHGFRTGQAQRGRGPLQ